MQSWKDLGEFCDKYRVILSLIVIVLIWSSLFFLFWNYGKALTTNPCSICAEKSGKDVVCFAEFSNAESIKFYKNGTIKEPERKSVTELLQQ